MIPTKPTTFFLLGFNVSAENNQTLMRIHLKHDMYMYMWSHTCVTPLLRWNCTLGSVQAAESEAQHIHDEDEREEHRGRSRLPKWPVCGYQNNTSHLCLRSRLQCKQMVMSYSLLWYDINTVSSDQPEWFHAFRGMNEKYTQWPLY